jgi:amino acid transporter
MPVNMMIVQALFITFWGGIYVILPGGVNSSYWMLFALATLVYIPMYFLMYAAAIKLRYSHPEVKRAFTVPGGKLGMWLLAGWGFASMAFLFILALVPPSQITSLNLSSTEYILLMLFGIIVITIVPFIIYHFKKPSWTPEKGSQGEKEAQE